MENIENAENIENEDFDQIPDAPAYTPRPKWQIIAAWVGLIVMLTCVGLYYWHIACGI